MKSEEHGAACVDVSPMEVDGAKGRPEREERMRCGVERQCDNGAAVDDTPDEHEGCEDGTGEGLDDESGATAHDPDIDVAPDGSGEERACDEDINHKGIMK